MAAQDIATALRRLESVFRRRPGAGVHDDAVATAHWESGTRVITHHANGKQVVTDMPVEFGGSGDQVSPGWLLRAGFASCTATCIAMAAAAEGIELQSLEVQARSRSDTRGVLGLTDADGEPVYAGPRDMQMVVKVSAPGIDAHRLRALIEKSYRNSPVVCAVQDAVPVALQIDIEAR